MARFAKRRLREGASVLDVGCGVGAQSLWLASEGYRVVPIDVSVTALERLNSRQMTEKARRNLTEPQLVDIATHDIDAGDGTFDAAIDVCCLQHITEQPKLFRAMTEIRRVLRPSGWFFSVIASDRHSLEKFGGMAARRHTAANVAALFKHTQFELVAVNSKEHTEDGFTVAHWVVEAVKKDI